MGLPYMRKLSLAIGWSKTQGLAMTQKSENEDLEKVSFYGLLEGWVNGYIPPWAELGVPGAGRMLLLSSMLNCI